MDNDAKFGVKCISTILIGAMTMLFLGSACDGYTSYWLIPIPLLAIPTVYALCAFFYVLHSITAWKLPKMKFERDES